MKESRGYSFLFVNDILDFKVGSALIPIRALAAQTGPTHLIHKNVSVGEL
jgi:hypothetical protein